MFGADPQHLTKEIVDAAADVAEADRLNRTSPEIQARSLGLGSAAHICAAKGLALMRALIMGKDEEATRIEGELTGGQCDPAWATTIKEYVLYFGPQGSRRDIPYVRAAKAGGPISIKPGARIALIADWGTGAEPAAQIARQIAALKPDLIVHLGDIYYSGTPEECRDNFTSILDREIGPSRSNVPVFALSGNHDMYCGGVGYYKMLSELNPNKFKQNASFFCLRSEDSSWQLLAMDTGLHDYSPFSVENAVTHIEEDEEEWLFDRVSEFEGRTILLSHHQLFSAFAPIGPTPSTGRASPCNPHLLATFGRLSAAGRIAAWFWGHEHVLGIYKPFAGLERGRCIGHGAIPIFTQDNVYKPLDNLSRRPGIVDGTRMPSDGDVYSHGFVMLQLGSSTTDCNAEYYQNLAHSAKVLFQETIA